MPARLPWPLVFQVLGVLAAVGLVVSTWEIWLLLFTALVLAAAIRPAARLGERYAVPRGVSPAGFRVSPVTSPCCSSISAPPPS